MRCPHCKSAMLPCHPDTFEDILSGEAPGPVFHCLLCGTYLDRVVVQNVQRQKMELALVNEASEIAREAMTKPMVWNGQ